VHAEPLNPSGQGLPAVLDDLKDNHPERWELLLAEMRRWLPEYDHIQFDKPQAGQKGVALRTRKGGHRIPAHQLSQGTLIALAMLTLAYLPDPPSVVGLEEIDHSLHPRLLRHLQDALYRLSYPESCGENRPPIQIIATTHSPYLLDMYRDHPEEVVLAEKKGLEVEMKRLTDIEHYEEILGDSPLSEVWYSGVLGGVSVKPCRSATTASRRPIRRPWPCSRKAFSVSRPSRLTWTWRPTVCRVSSARWTAFSAAFISTPTLRG